MLGGFPRSRSELKSFLLIEEALNDDWQSRITVRLFRWGQWLTRQTGPQWSMPAKAWWLLYRLWFETFLGADLLPALEIGPGVRFAHGGRSVVIHHRCVIGARATIYHGVTVGMRGEWEVPVIGDDVVLGAGCAVVGNLHIGNGAAVGPNVVVVADVAPGAHVVAAPAVTVGSTRALASQRRTNRGRTVARISPAAPDPTAGRGAG